MTETLKDLISRMSEGDAIEGLGNGEVIIKPKSEPASSERKRLPYPNLDTHLGRSCGK